MRIVIDARTVRDGRTGVGLSTESLLYGLDEIAGPNEITALTLKTPAFRHPLKHIRLRETRADYESHPRGEWFLNVTLPGILKAGLADVFWGPAFLIPWVRTAARKVVTIHDLAHFIVPECYPCAFGAFLRFATRRSIRAADAVVCDSDATRQDVLNLFPEARQKRIEIVHLAADPFFAPTEKAATVIPSDLPTPFLLAIGSGTPRKNIGFLVKVYQRLKSSGGIGHSLVVVGDSSGLPDFEGIRYLPFHDNHALRRLYCAADLFAFPSLYEGFGIPMIEAMACGCPVAASGGGAVREVGGEAAAYFHENDEEDAARTLSRILSSESERNRLREAGLRRAREYSWAKSATKLLNLFQSLAKDVVNER